MSLNADNKSDWMLSSVEIRTWISQFHQQESISTCSIQLSSYKPSSISHNQHISYEWSSKTHENDPEHTSNDEKNEKKIKTRWKRSSQPIADLTYTVQWRPQWHPQWRPKWCPQWCPIRVDSGAIVRKQVVNSIRISDYSLRFWNLNSFIQWFSSG